MFVPSPQLPLPPLRSRLRGHYCTTTGTRNICAFASTSPPVLPPCLLVCVATTVRRQHRIKEYGAELSRLMLEQGAYVYVCGDGNAMAQGVHRALVEALVEHGGAGVGAGAEGGGEKGAEAVLRAMKEKRRYVLDVWS